MPADYPSLEEIEPLPVDPVKAFIKIAKQTGMNIAEIPHPIAKIAGSQIQLIANQHEALHMTFMNMVRTRNFARSGGFEALEQEMDELIQMTAVEK